MHRLSIHAKTALALCAALAFLAGCGTEADGGPEAGCVAAYDDSYRCHSLVRDVSALDPVYSSGKPQECAEFVRNLDDGRYWLTGTDETGAAFDSLVVVGETGWMQDGKSEKAGMMLLMDWLCIDTCGFVYGDDDVVCRLESVTVDSIRGACEHNASVTSGKWSPVAGTIAEESECEGYKCPFAFAVGVSDADSLKSAIVCLRQDLIGIGESYADESTTVTVSVSDTLVSIAAPNVEVTWTKRPGL